ncbi:ADP-ribosylglycohydrolase family protein [uncultured Arcticibacterium sp.]|uniref:ADP-ribosylglycohydrolase family protein n=1 Tax=uncultured Arcticibacterium sp. TaxID=2173042 RepID=UPI0030F7D802
MQLEKQLYNKVLGNIVGSAIGDAMGAPMEMWSREDIKASYGFVDKLFPLNREASPEGPWKENLPAGGTTDDTRWKELVFKYLSKQKSKELDAKEFASEILAFYDNAHLGNDKENLKFLKTAWVQEWVKVARPFKADNLVGFADGLSSFYGGEMVCAGLLYATAIGAFFPEEPLRAYNEMYKLSIFDIGYARDLSGLSAAMTAVSMAEKPSKESVIEVLKTIDPYHYAESRLVGRTSSKILDNALDIAEKSKGKSIETAFEMLDAQLQDMPFHAGEIYLQVLVAMFYSDFKFEETMQFLVNYGRDNDTTAALAGGILGTFHGFDALPYSEAKAVIKVSKEELNIDLEKLAKELTNTLLEVV